MEGNSFFPRFRTLWPVCMSPTWKNLNSENYSCEVPIIKAWSENMAFSNRCELTHEVVLETHKYTHTHTLTHTVVRLQFFLQSILIYLYLTCSSHSSLPHSPSHSCEPDIAGGFECEGMFSYVLCIRQMPVDE